MKSICIFHTRSGISKDIATEISRGINAELLQISDGKSRKGFFGYISAAVSGLKKSLPTLLLCAPSHPLEEYDRVIIVAPVWCENVSPVMRAFLLQNKNRFKGELYYVIGSMSGISYKQKIDELELLTGKAYTGILQLKTHKNDWSGEVAEFTERLKM